MQREKDREVLHVKVDPLFLTVMMAENVFTTASAEGGRVYTYRERKTERYCMLRSTLCS